MSDSDSVAKYFDKKVCKNINHANPHYVVSLAWEDLFLKLRLRAAGFKVEDVHSEIKEFPNYEEACEFVRTELDDTDLYEECGLSINWMIIDLFTLEITNYDICTFRKVSLLQEEEEYKKEFALAIEKVLASKAFTLGLALKLSMRNCGFDLS
jgi:hypothetical protein